MSNSALLKNGDDADTIKLLHRESLLILCSKYINFKYNILCSVYK